jgi:error-prone DNA polymerase
MRGEARLLIKFTFRSLERLFAFPIPSLNRKELTLLARIGGLNNLDRVEHRRDALWQVERAGKLEGPLLRAKSALLEDDSESSPLQQMTTDERLISDYSGTGLTIANIRWSIDVQSCDGK